MTKTELQNIKLLIEDPNSRDLAFEMLVNNGYSKFEAVKKICDVLIFDRFTGDGVSVMHEDSGEIMHQWIRNFTLKGVRYSFNFFHKPYSVMWRKENEHLILDIYDPTGEGLPKEDLQKSIHEFIEKSINFLDC